MIKNLTPHRVVLYSDDNTVLRSYDPTGLARVSQSSVIVDMVDGVEVVAITYGQVENLPDPDGQTMYIVSALTAQAAFQNGRGCDDLLLTADPVRNDEGHVVGCRRFARYI